MVDTIKNVVQLSEAVSHPDGYNTVDIEGRGDEKRLDVFAWVTLTSPQSQTGVSSNGADYVDLKIEINDPNSDNPFARSPNLWQKTTVDGENRFEITASKYIHNLIKVFEYVSGDAEGNYDETYEIPAEYLSHDGRKIYISPNYHSPLHPLAPGWSGPAGPDIVVVYDGGDFISLRQGSQAGAFWWEEEPEEDETEGEVGGVFFDGGNAPLEAIGDILPLPDVEGQTATLYAKFRPEAGEYGQSTLNVNYSNVADDVVVPIILGDLSNVDMQLSAEPTSIEPEARSIISLYLTDYKGAPLNDVEVAFYLYAPNGFGELAKGPSGTTGSRETGDYEALTSSADSLDELDVSYPVEKLNDIRVAEGDPTSWTWDGKAAITGTKIKLTEGNEIPDGDVALEVLYDHGGFIQCEYIAPPMGIKEAAQIVKVKADVSGTSAMVNITVDPGKGSQASLSINANPSSLALQEEGVVSVTLTDPDGEPLTGKKVKLSLTSLDGGSGNGTIVGSISPKLGDEEEVSGSISDRYTISAPGPIGSVTKVEFAGDVYGVDSFKGTKITLTDPLPVASGSVTLTYKTSGVATTPYTAPNRDVKVTINAYYEEDDLLASTTVTVGTPGVEAEMTVTLSSQSITAPEKCRISAYLHKGGTPVEGAICSIRKMSGPGLAPVVLIGPTTGEDGLAEWCYETVKNGGISVFEVEASSIPGFSGKMTETAKINVAARPNISASERLIEVLLGEVSGWMDPVSGLSEITDGSTIDSWGSAKGADGFGGVEAHPSQEGDPITISWSPTAHIYSADFRSVVVSGMTWVPDDFESGDSAAFWILEGLILTTPWGWEYNRRQTTVQVVLRHAPESPISGTQVSIQGQTAVTDESGNAQFLNLTPGDDQDIEIYSPNHKLNRSDMSIQTGHDQADENPHNKTITISAASTKPYRLKLTEFSASVKATVAYSPEYEAFMISGGHFEIPSEDDAPEASTTSTGVDPCATEEEEAP